jgi:hypothetical protein
LQLINLYSPNLTNSARSRIARLSRHFAIFSRISWRTDTAIPSVAQAFLTDASIST